MQDAGDTPPGRGGDRLRERGPPGTKVNTLINLTQKDTKSWFIVRRFVRRRTQRPALFGSCRRHVPPPPSPRSVSHQQADIRAPAPGLTSVGDRCRSSKETLFFMSMILSFFLVCVRTNPRVSPSTRGTSVKRVPTTTRHFREALQRRAAWLRTGSKPRVVTVHFDIRSSASPPRRHVALLY